MKTNMPKLRFKALACASALLWILDTQAQATQGNDMGGLLEQNIRAISQAVQTKPTGKGPKWRKWTTQNATWNTLVATASSQEDTTLADWVMIASDTLPLIAMTSRPKARRYDCIKLDKKLCQGWDVLAKSSNPQGIVDWVALKNPTGELFLSGFDETGMPRTIIMPTGEGSHLILDTDAKGEALESMLIFNAEKKTVEVCCNFALNEEKIRYLFVRNDHGDWLELTYAKGIKKPVGIAKHHKMPGQLSSVLLDLNRDGKLDVLGHISGMKGKATQLKMSDLVLSSKLVEKADSLKTKMTGDARKAHQIWLEAQWFWSKLKPMGVQMPLRYPMDTKK
jgi:hypothetical protein